MHYGNLVIIERPQDGDMESAVAKTMGPNEENGGFWDWYQIGGRWTGALDGYDPEKDPANLEHCEYCNGTGDRPDLTPPEWKAECGGCNGCHGKGRKMKWPTQWEMHPGDIAPIESVTTEKYKFYRVITPCGQFPKERYMPWRKGNYFEAQEQPPLEWLQAEYPGHLAVVVDNHC